MHSLRTASARTRSAFHTGTRTLRTTMHTHDWTTTTGTTTMHGRRTASARTWATFHTRSRTVGTTMHAHGWTGSTRTATTHGLGPAPARTWATFHTGARAVGTTMHAHGLGTAPTRTWATFHCRTRAIRSAWSAAKTCLHFFVGFLELLLRDAAVSIRVDASEDCVGVGHPAGWRSRPTTLWASARRLRLDDGAQSHNDGKRGNAHPNGP